MSQGLQIGIVAQRTGLSVDAIRFYEREGLVTAPVRSDGGFRLFQAEDIEEFQFIQSAQELDFSLDEIRELLALRNGAPKPCLHVEQLLEKKLASVRHKMAVLQGLEAKLRKAQGQCQEAFRTGRTHLEAECPVLEQIASRSDAGRQK